MHSTTGLTTELPAKFPKRDALVISGTNSVAEDLPVKQLNWVETKIIRLVAQGLQNGEIGEQLSLSEGAVKWHMQRIFDKLGVRRRALAVQQAHKLGIIKVYGEG